MKKRKILLVVLCFLMLFMVTGCGKKTVLTTDEFKAKVTELGYTTQDAKEQFADKDFVKDVTIALNSKGFQVEFYVFADEASAVSSFNTNQTSFENVKSGKSIETSSSMANYSEYSLESSGKYMHVCRVETTLLFVSVDVKYKDEAKKLIKELGY